MADNYLITGYWGEPHVTAENDRGINAAVFGSGRFVLPVGEQFKAEYIGNNTVRLYDGKLLDNGAAAGIPAGKYIDLLIAEAGQGMNRNDLIIFQYSQDASTLIETGVFIVLQGAETNGTAIDPVLTQEDLLTDEASFDQMELYRVKVSGAVISEPEILFNTKFAGERIATAHSDDGINYTVNFPGIVKLYNGLEITVIPDKSSVQPNIKLNLNGLGEKYVRMTLPFSSGNSGALAKQNGWFSADAPMTLRYHEKMNTWKSDLQRQSASALYGSVVSNETVNLTASGWANNQQTVEADYVTEDNNIFVSPAPSSHAAYCKSGVRCTAQAAGSLTFECDKVPSSSLSVNLAIIE